MKNPAIARALVMVSLVIAGEAIFGLPFHVSRFFRPTILQVFDLTNLELGSAMSLYGIVAMVSYFLGGPLADRFSARRLMVAALVTTSLGGIGFAAVPSLGVLNFLYAFWGVTTILLFWAALIRATREWGGSHEQGLAYGLLDGGRGLWAAVVASSAVFVFGLLIGKDPELATDAERALAFSKIIYIYTGTTLATAVLVWFFVPESKLLETDEENGTSVRRISWRMVLTVARIPGIWFQALIVICAYVTFKATDNYSLYTVDAYGMNEVDGAAVSALGAWMRPVAAVGAGILGDKIRSSRVIAWCFALLVATYLHLALLTPDPQVLLILYVHILATCAATFALRGVYFALFEEAEVPMAATGTAVGIVSVLGYTPDVFFGPVSGWLLDRSPGLPGHQHVFLALAATSVLGFVATVLFMRFCSVQPGRAISLPL